MGVSKNERDLIRAAQQGDQSAVVALYEQHRDNVYTYIYHRVGCNPDIAEDITADVFVRMVSNLHTYKVKSAPLMAWLYTIARNRIIDYYRDADKRKDAPLSENLVDTMSLPETHVARSYDLDEVRAAIENLTDSQRDVLICRFMNEMSVKETAQVLNRTEGAIKTLTRRAIAALQREIRSEVRYA